MRLILKDKGIDRVLKKAVIDHFRKQFKRIHSLFEKEVKLLAMAFATSEEFKAIKSKLAGEFGFTPEELSGLDRVIDVLKNDASVTNIEIMAGAGVQEIMLNWCDIERLKVHPVAIHKLTKYNGETRSWELTDVVSWIEWLEDGATVRGFNFDPTMRGKWSRSGHGMMYPREGGMWVFNPTKVFERLPETINSAANIEKGIGLVLRMGE